MTTKEKKPVFTRYEIINQIDTVSDWINKAEDELGETGHISFQVFTPNSTYRSHAIDPTHMRIDAGERVRKYYVKLVREKIRDQKNIRENLFLKLQNGDYSDNT